MLTGTETNKRSKRRCSIQSRYQNSCKRTFNMICSVRAVKGPWVLFIHCVHLRRKVPMNMTQRSLYITPKSMSNLISEKTRLSECLLSASTMAYLRIVRNQSQRRNSLSKPISRAEEYSSSKSSLSSTCFLRILFCLKTPGAKHILTIAGD